MATADQYGEVAEVMFEAVRHGPSPYSEEQRRAWVPRIPGGTAWVERLEAQVVFVAEDAGQVVGFMTLAPGGYIDLAYVRPACQRRGVFRRLYDAVEDAALQEGLDRLWVHASVTAKPAFAAVGFAVVRREAVELDGQELERFEMEKPLAGLGERPSS